MGGIVKLACAVAAAILALPVEARMTALVGATLIDMTDKGHTTTDIVNSIVLINQGKIVATGRAGKVRIPRGTEVISVHGEFLIPGLIDGYGAIRSQAFADAYLSSGVTTVIVPMAPRSGGFDGENTVASLLRSPSVLRAIPIAGYSSDGSQPQTHPWKDHRQRDRPQGKGDLRTRVDKLAGQGVRVIEPTMDVLPWQLETIVREAHRRGMAVAAQLAFTTYRQGAAAGVDYFARNDKYSLSLASVEDFAAYADDPSGTGGRAASRAVCSGAGAIDAAGATFAALLRRSHTALMPVLEMEATADDIGGPNPWTLPAARFFNGRDLDDPVDAATGARPYLKEHPDRRDQIQTCARQKQAIDGKLMRIGVTYLAGTSSPSYGVMPGSSLHVELALMAELGLSPREALATATGNFGAIAAFRDRALIARGRRADIVVLKDDPRVSLDALEAIDILMFDGHVIDRAALTGKT